MREIGAQRITETVKRLCIEANCHLPNDMKSCIEASYDREDWAPAREILERIMENYQIAANENRPICQDTGLACAALSKDTDDHCISPILEF